MKRFILGLLTGIALSWLFRKRDEMPDEWDWDTWAEHTYDSGMENTQPILDSGGGENSHNEIRD